jgi:hypothetical protein
LPSSSTLKGGRGGEKRNNRINDWFQQEGQPETQIMGSVPAIKRWGRP